MTPEDVRRLQELLDSKNNTGVNLDLNPSTGKLTWGCVRCDAALILLADKCEGGSYFPGRRCKGRTNYNE